MTISMPDESSTDPTMRQELDSPNEEGFTWLMRAAASGNTEVCRELYNAGANPNIIEPKTGRTALHFCAEFDQAQVTALLKPQHH